MRRSSKLQLSQPALYFSAGVAVGVLIGAAAGYLGRGIQTDDRDLVIQQDIWNPRGQETDLEQLLGGSATEPRPDAPAPADAPWQDSDAARAADEAAAGTPPSEADEAQNVPADVFGFPDEDGPSPANPSEDSVDPGGLRLSDDPARSYDAPDP